MAVHSRTSRTSRPSRPPARPVSARPHRLFARLCVAWTLGMDPETHGAHIISPSILPKNLLEPPSAAIDDRGGTVSVICTMRPRLPVDAIVRPPAARPQVALPRTFFPGLVTADPSKGGCGPSSDPFPGGRGPTTWFSKNPIVAVGSGSFDAQHLGRGMGSATYVIASTPREPTAAVIGMPGTCRMSSCVCGCCRPSIWHMGSR